MRRMLLIFLVIIAFTAIYLAQKKNEVNNFISGIVPSSGSLKMYEDTLLYSYESDSTWTPLRNVDFSSQPEIVGSSGILIDLKTGRVLFEKNASERRQIASLVKVMTAIVALEHLPLKAEVNISNEAALVGENIMGISAGEKYILEELLYGLILNSGNDAAYAIAQGVAGSVETFVDWMNIKAEELGLKDTYFADPSGLDDTTYSTVYDLAKLTKYAMKNPEFRKISATFEKEVYGKDHKYIYMQNQTNLLTTYPGVAGVKTGYTEAAGLCLITYAKLEDTELVGVVLNSIDRKGDMVLMLDWGFGLSGVEVDHNLL